MRNTHCQRFLPLKEYTKSTQDWAGNSPVRALSRSVCRSPCNSRATSRSLWANLALSYIPLVRPACNQLLADNVNVIRGYVKDTAVLMSGIEYMLLLPNFTLYP